MKLLIFDKLQRGWLTWSLYSLIFFIVGLTFPMMLGTLYFHDWWWMLWLGFLANSTTTELANGYGRIALTLPFTTRQIGRFLWFISVAMPTLLLALLSGLGVFIIELCSGFQSGVFLAWIQLVLMGLLLFGSLFWIVSGTPLSPSEKWQRRFAQQTSGLAFFLVLACGGYFLYKIKWNFEIKYFIICFLGLILTILGWLRAEGLVVDYSEYRRGASYEIKTTNNFHPRPGFGGIPFLMIRSLLRLMGMSALIIVFFIGLNLFGTRHFSVSNLFENVPMTQLWLCFFIITEGMRFLLHLKFLRTMPLTSKQLAGIILACALLPLLISSGICAALICMSSGLPDGLSLFKIYLLALAPICVLVTTAVWHGERRFERIVLTIAVFLIASIAPIYQMVTDDLPIYFVIGYPIVFIIFALFAISYLLEANDMTYRIRPHDIKGFDQMNWS